jgi:hydrogenase maturation protein HypF
MTPTIIPLPRPMPDVLAVGAFLKNTLCAIHGDRAVMSPSIGNLDSPEAIAAFDQTAIDLSQMTGGKPALLAHDLHPDFYSTRWAESQTVSTLAVQHHHAHIAAVAAEHGLEEPVIGLALDGFGLGPEKQSWGGELLLVDGPDYRRLGHLALLPQPGADLASRQPWRMGAAILHQLGRGGEIANRFDKQSGAAMLDHIIAKKINCPLTSSAGRLFDAACGLLGLHLVADFEGQAPMALEALVTRPRTLRGGWTIETGVLDCLPLMESLIDRDASDGADLFHGTLIAAMLEWVTEVSASTGIRKIAMSGGCFFNKILRQGMADGLTNLGLTSFLPNAVSPGDPGISLGQAWVAALTVERTA